MGSVLFNEYYRFFNLFNNDLMIIKYGLMWKVKYVNYNKVVWFNRCKWINLIIINGVYNYENDSNCESKFSIRYFSNRNNNVIVLNCKCEWI